MTDPKIGHLGKFRRTDESTAAVSIDTSLIDGIPDRCAAPVPGPPSARRVISAPPPGEMGGKDNRLFVIIPS